MNRLEDIVPVELQDELITRGFRMDREEINVENCHDLMSIDMEMGLISNRDFKRCINVRNTDGRMNVYVADDKIKMMMNGKGKVSMTVKGIALSGAKKFMVLQEVVRHGIILDTSENDQWISYAVLWNGKVYNVGYMAENYYACYMSKYWEKLPKTPEDYKNAWAKHMSTHSYKELPAIQTDEGGRSSPYGHNDVGLGSIYTDPIVLQIEEITEWISKVKDKGYAQEALDDLRAVLQTD